jgi:hypothetical protein
VQNIDGSCSASTTVESGHDPLGDVIKWSDLPAQYPVLFPKPSSAEWLIRNRERNGLAEIVFFVGRTAFVSRSDFARWVKSNQGSTRPA